MSESPKDLKKKITDCNTWLKEHQEKTPDRRKKIEEKRDLEFRRRQLHKEFQKKDKQQKMKKKPL